MAFSALRSILGVTPEDHARSPAIFYAKCAALAIPVALLLRGNPKRGSQPLPGAEDVLHTDFDAFLVKMNGAPTGLDDKKAKAASMRGKVCEE